jgi:predicted Fe-Mo cluster-binding NifX family protein
MKVAVSAAGQTLEAPVDPRFGRAAAFVIVDVDTGAVEARENTQNLQAAQGAGIQTARSVVEWGAGAVLTGNVGPKAFFALRAAGVKVYAGASGTVREAVEQYKAGRLKETDEATVESHWM